MHVTNLAIFFIGYQTYELLMSFRRAVHDYNNEIQTPEVAPQFVPLHNEGAGETIALEITQLLCKGIKRYASNS